MKQPILLQVDRSVLEMKSDELQDFIMKQADNINWCGPDRRINVIYQVDKGEKVKVIQVDNGDVYLVTLGNAMEMEVV